MSSDSYSPYDAAIVCTAAAIGDLEKLKKMVLENKAAINCSDYDDRTPLHIAVSESMPHIVDYLLEAGADVNCTDRWESTPLQDALRITNDDILQKLTQKGAKVGNQGAIAEQFVRACGAGDEPLVRRLHDAGANVNASDYDKRTPLHLAASEGHLEIVQFLIKEGANINDMDRWGGTPLLDAVTNKHDTVATELRNAGAKLPASEQISATVCSAASDGDIGAVKRLLSSGASANSHDYDNRTVLHLAVEAKNLELVKFLVQAGANINASDNWGGRPLDPALLFACSDIADFLKSKGAEQGQCEEEKGVSFTKSGKQEPTDTVAELETQPIATIVNKMTGAWEHAGFQSRCLQAIAAKLNADKKLVKSLPTEANSLKVICGAINEHQFSKEVLGSGMTVLRILATEDDNAPLIASGGGIRLGIGCLKEADAHCRAEAAHFLSNISFPGAKDAEKISVTFAKQDGIRAILNILQSYQEEPDAVHRAIKTIWHVCLVDAGNIKRVANEKGLEAITEVWKLHPTELELIGSCCGASSCLLKLDDQRVVFLDNLRGGDLAFDTLKRNKKSEETVEYALSVLATIVNATGTQKTVHSILKRKKALPMLVELLRAYPNSQSIQENSALLIYCLLRKTDRPERMVAQLNHLKGSQALAAAHKQYPDSKTLSNIFNEVQHFNTKCCIM